MRRVLVLLVAGLLSACAGIPVEERPARRADIDGIAQETIARLTAADPSLQSELDSSVGFMSARLSSVSAPIVGGGSGLGVVVNHLDQSRTYVNVRRFDLSAAVGAQTYRVLVVFQDKEVMESFSSGRWQTGAGADAVAGSSGGSAVGGAAIGFTVRILTDTGMLAGGNVRLVRISINHDLTDTGISEITIPNRGFDTEDGYDQGPRSWDRWLPFLAQRVVDRGYDLPLPLGTGVTYAYTDQEQLIDNLNIGFNGGEKTQINFVTFDEVVSKSDSAQLKVDAWLFPFMNVFGMVGKVDGNAPVIFTLDGNQALEDLEDNGLVDCTPSNAPPFQPPPICLLFEDSSVTLPIDADFNGITYGIGTTLAVGMNGWFATVPIVVTYADLEDKNNEGLVTTITPRGGKVIGMGRWGNLALFAGGQYLDSQLDVESTYFFGDTGLSVDYKVSQQNKDRWNLLLGGNWNFNKHWSWMMEYSGFIGSREGFITSVAVRF